MDNRLKPAFLDVNIQQEINRDPQLIDPILINFFTDLSIECKIKYKKDFRIFEGHRTLERQKILKSKGFSKTLKSKHLYNPSKAIDIIEFPWTWNGFILTPVYKNLVLEILKKHPKVSWGGVWKSFVDLPHFQI